MALVSAAIVIAPMTAGANAHALSKINGTTHRSGNAAASVVSVKTKHPAPVSATDNTAVAIPAGASASGHAARLPLAGSSGSALGSLGFVALAAVGALALSRRRRWARSLDLQ